MDYVLLSTDVAKIMAMIMARSKQEMGAEMSVGEGHPD